MTNLQRWFLYLALLGVPYISIILGPINTAPLQKWKLEIQLLPLVFLVAFGLYAAGTVLYRTFTFNDCPAAAKELHEQIQEARKDLISKGFKFRD